MTYTLHTFFKIESVKLLVLRHYEAAALAESWPTNNSITMRAPAVIYCRVAIAIHMFE